MGFIITMTPSIEGYNITKYINPIVIPTVGTGSILKDLFASFTDTFGGKSSAYQKQFTKFIDEGVQKIITEAKQAGANAIINYRIETTNIEINGKSMFSIINYGQAVFIEEK